MNEEEQKEFRGQLRNAWIQTSLERDKSILTLSFGAIGLLFVIVDQLPIDSKTTLLIFLLAILAFVVSVVSIVWIFQENRSLLESQLKEKEENSKLAGFLDKLAVGGFLLGLFFSCILVFQYAMNSYDNNTLKRKEQKMSNENESQKKLINGSFEGIDNISPDKSKMTATNSFKKISKIAPTKPTTDKPSVESKDANQSE